MAEPRDVPSFSAVPVEVPPDFVDGSPVGDFGSSLLPVLTSGFVLVGCLLGADVAV